MAGGGRLRGHPRLPPGHRPLPAGAANQGARLLSAPQRRGDRQGEGLYAYGPGDVLRQLDDRYRWRARRQIKRVPAPEVRHLCSFGPLELAYFHELLQHLRAMRSCIEGVEGTLHEGGVNRREFVTRSAAALSTLAAIKTAFAETVKQLAPPAQIH